MNFNWKGASLTTILWPHRAYPSYIYIQREWSVSWMVYREWSFGHKFSVLSCCPWGICWQAPNPRQGRAHYSVCVLNPQEVYFGFQKHHTNMGSWWYKRSQTIEVSKAFASPFSPLFAYLRCLSFLDFPRISSHARPDASPGSTARGEWTAKKAVH